MEMAQQILNFILNFIDRIYRKNERHLLDIEQVFVYKEDTFLQDLKGIFSPSLGFFSALLQTLFVCSLVRSFGRYTCDVCLFVMYIWTDGKYFVVKLILTLCRFVFFRICDVVVAQYNSSACLLMRLNGRAHQSHESKWKGKWRCFPCNLTEKISVSNAALGWLVLVHWVLCACSHHFNNSWISQITNSKKITSSMYANTYSHSTLLWFVNVAIQQNFHTVALCV